MSLWRVSLGRVGSDLSGVCWCKFCSWAQLREEGGVGGRGSAECGWTIALHSRTAPSPGRLSPPERGERREVHLVSCPVQCYHITVNAFYLSGDLSVGDYPFLSVKQFICKKNANEKKEAANDEWFRSVVSNLGADTSLRGHKSPFYIHMCWLGLTWCVSPARQGFPSPL